MNDDLDTSENVDAWPISNTTGLPRRSGDILNKNLAKVREIASQSEQQLNSLSTSNIERRAKINEWRKRVENTGGIVATSDPIAPPGDSNISNAAHDSLYNQVNEDMKRMQQPSSPSLSATNDSMSREIELQMALQAERQQAALMRKTLEERERALNALESQVQTLADEIEDHNREQEMEGFTKSLDPSENAASSFGLESRVSTIREQILATDDGTHSEFDISHLFAPESFEQIQPKKSFPWALIGKIAGGISLLGVTVVGGILIWPRISDMLSKFSIPPVAITGSPQPVPNTNIAISAPPKVVTPPTASVAKPKPQLVAPIPTITQKHIVLPPIQDRLRSGGMGPQMVKIPAGQFSMGVKSIWGAPMDEQPLHDVTIKAFYIAATETSFDEYDHFARISGRKLPNDSDFGRGSRPVINVNWEDVQAYVEWLSAETGKNYYLPSEAQWEYAARAGTDTNYWWGNKYKPDQKLAVCFYCGTQWQGTTAPVGSLQPNPFGVYDTAGNVMEWVQDCYNVNYDEAPTDGNPWLAGDCSQRMTRGGSFNKPIASARSTARSQLPANGRFNMLGFRVARD